MTIRRAVRGDIPALVLICKRHHKEEKFGWPFDPAQISMTLAHAIDAADWLCLTGNKSILLASAYISPMGAGRIAVEHIIRSERAGQFDALRNAYEAWARSLGCVMTSLGCTSNVPAFARLYRRGGYRHGETIFVKVLK